MNNEIKLSNRILAYLLDILLVYVIISFAVSIKFINPNYDKYIEEYEKYSEILSETETENMNKIVDELKDSFYYISKYGVSYNIVSSVILLLYFGVFQKYNKGQTLGKKIMKIKVVDNNSNENSTLIQHLIRSILLQFIYVGGIIPMLLNSILVYFLNSQAYLYCYFAIVMIFMIFNIISFFFIIFRKDKRGLHDLLAGTKVVKE